MTSTIDRPPSGDNAYGLARPSPKDLRRSLGRVFADDADALWRAICTDAGVDPDRHSSADVTVLVSAMERHADGAVRLCAQSFMIRVRSYEHLSQAGNLVRSTT